MREALFPVSCEFSLNPDVCKPCKLEEIATNLTELVIHKATEEILEQAASILVQGICEGPIPLNGNEVACGLTARGLIKDENQQEIKETQLFLKSAGNLIPNHLN